MEKMRKTIYRKIISTKIDTFVATINMIDTSYNASIYIEALRKEFTSYHKNERDAFMWLLGLQQYTQRIITNYIRRHKHNIEACKREVLITQVINTLEYFHLPQPKKEYSVTEIYQLVNKLADKLSSNERHLLAVELHKF